MNVKTRKMIRGINYWTIMVVGWFITLFLFTYSMSFIFWIVANIVI